MDWIHLIELVGTAAATGWGAFERARAKRRAAEAKEKELARQKAIAEKVAQIEMEGGKIGSILDHLKDFDALWRPIPKAKVK